MDSPIFDQGSAIRKIKKEFKFLLHSFSATGHVLPMQAVAKALVDRGHEVVWLNSPAQESRVLASGATFYPTEEVALVDAALMVAKPTNLVETIQALFGGRVTAQVADLRRVLSLFSPDCLLIDALPMGAGALYDLGEIPIYATLGVVPMYLQDDSPEDLPATPDNNKNLPRSTLGMLLSRPKMILPTINSQRAELGLPPLKVSDALHYSPFLHIQASCATLEFQDRSRPSLSYPRPHYVGPLVAPMKSVTFKLPSWWADVTSSTCVIGITQGTFAVDPCSLLIPAIEALSDDSNLLLVVMSQDADQIRKMVRVTANMRIAEWVPYDQLLPQCRLFITNGGYGSITQALSHGVPVVCAGTTEDKKDTAHRVTWVGAGIDLQTDSPSRMQIQEAVRTILNDTGYKENAGKIAKELTELGGAGKACDLLEEMVGQFLSDRS